MATPEPRAGARRTRSIVGDSNLLSPQTRFNLPLPLGPLSVSVLEAWRGRWSPLAVTRVRRRIKEEEEEEGLFKANVQRQSCGTSLIISKIQSPHYCQNYIKDLGSEGVLPPFPLPLCISSQSLMIRALVPAGSASGPRYLIRPVVIAHIRLAWSLLMRLQDLRSPFSPVMRHDCVKMGESSL